MAEIEKEVREDDDIKVGEEVKEGEEVKVEV